MKLWKIFSLVAIFSIIGVFTVGIAQADLTTDDVIANVTVEEACLISLDTNAITFGSMAPGEQHDTDVAVEISNLGNIEANVTILGTAWDDGNGNDFAVGQTLWNTTTQEEYAGTALTGAPVLAIEDLAFGTPESLYFGLAVPAGTPAGTYEQTITFTLVCD